MTVKYMYRSDKLRVNYEHRANKILPSASLTISWQVWLFIISVYYEQISTLPQKRKEPKDKNYWSPCA